MNTHTLGIHGDTYDAIFQHPIARNLKWLDVTAMIGAMPDVVMEEREGTLKLARNGRTCVMHRPPRKNITDVQELMDLRRFLEHSAAAREQSAAPGAHLLVVIDHRMARVYKTELHGSVPELIVPYDAAGAGRHLHHVEDGVHGQRRLEDTRFYAEVARTLERAEKVLLFGSGTGASSAMDRLLAELDRHHPDVRRRVIGAVVVDDAHMTEDQLLAKARSVYAALPAPASAAAPTASAR